MFVASAVAVESEIVGNDRDAELICGVFDSRKSCSCCLLAANNAAAADWASLVFGEVEKN